MFRPVGRLGSTPASVARPGERSALGEFDATAPPLARDGALAAVPVRRLLLRALQAESLPSRIMTKGGLSVEFFERLSDAAFVASGKARTAALAQRDAVQRVVRESLERWVAELGPGPLDGMPLHHAMRFAELLRDGLRSSRELRAIAGQTVSGPGPRHDFVIDKAMEQVRLAIAEAIRHGR